jgi:hypothetical protein
MFGRGEKINKCIYKIQIKNRSEKLERGRDLICLLCKESLQLFYAIYY